MVRRGTGSSYWANSFPEQNLHRRNCRQRVILCVLHYFSWNFKALQPPALLPGVEAGLVLQGRFSLLFFQKTALV
jgi:hypothetical protein